jgi:ParB family chromosome partitioning protein
MRKARSKQASAEITSLVSSELPGQVASVRQKIFETGTQNRAFFDFLNQSATSLDMNLEEADWMMWQGFLAAVLPILSGIGQGHSSLFLKKMLAELKGKTPKALWEEVHPEQEDGSRTTAPEAPEGWTL